MEFKGTKGEWSYIAGDVNKVTIVKIYDAHEFELEINCKNRIEEEIANAKLIASAPDLLEALIKIRKSIKDQKLESNFGHTLYYVDEAIKKALL